MLPTYRLRGWYYDPPLRRWYGHRFGIDSPDLDGTGHLLTGELLYVEETSSDRDLNSRVGPFKEGDVVSIRGEAYRLEREFGL